MKSKDKKRQNLLKTHRVNMCKKVSLFLAIFSLFFSIQTLIAASEDINVGSVFDINAIIDQKRDDAALFDNTAQEGLGKALKKNSVLPGPYQWVFMVYMDGDNSLESYAIDDFLEMAQVGSSYSNVAIAVQMDRIPGNDSRYGDWTGCARFMVEQGDTPVLENADYDWGDGGPYEMEVDMGDTQTLVNFVNWVINEKGYYAPRYALILWDHGDGWREQIEKLKKELETKGETLSLEEKENILNKITELERKLQEQGGALKAVCIDDTDGGVLHTKDIRDALEVIRTPGQINIDLIGFDACLMGMLEVAHEIRNYGTVMVASEKTEDNAGWPYNTILNDLTDTPTMTPEELGTAIVERYGESASGEDDTLSAVWLGMQLRPIIQQNGIEFLSKALSDFADTMIRENTDWDVIFNAQQQAGHYTYTSYRDLKGFIEYVAAHAINENIAIAAQNVEDIFDQCIIANYSSTADKGNGLSIYFPDWYWGDADGGYPFDIDPDYNDTNLLFLQDTGGYVTNPKGSLPYTQYWDEFLEEYMDTYLVPNHTGERTYSRSIPGGTTASAYVMISSPVSPADESDPVANLEDDLGAYDPEVWRLFRWNPMLNPPDYEEYPDTEHEVENEEAYWLISRDTKDIDITGDLEETNQPYFIPLEPGWNQIGTPFDFDIDWDMVQVNSGEKPYVTSAENILTSRTLWKYADGDYTASAVMEPGEGYWIENLTSRSLSIIVNPVPSTLYADSISSLESTLTMIAKLEENQPPPPPTGIDGEELPSGSSDEGNGGNSGCFIATACFGSPMAGEVRVLRNFRDKYLLSNSIGQIFVSLYYRYSPPVARFIGNHKFLKIMVRSGLYPIVKGCAAFGDTLQRTDAGKSVVEDK